MGDAPGVVKSIVDDKWPEWTDIARAALKGLDAMVEIRGAEVRDVLISGTSVTDEMVLRAAKAMWKVSVPPGEENNFPDHPCIAQSLYLRAAYAGIHAALNP